MATSRKLPDESTTSLPSGVADAHPAYLTVEDMQKAIELVSPEMQALQRIEHTLLTLCELLQTPPEDDIWGCKEIAEHMKMNPMMVRQKVLIRDSFPKPRRFTGKAGGQRRWLKAEVLAWIRNCKDINDESESSQEESTNTDE